MYSRYFLLALNLLRTSKFRVSRLAFVPEVGMFDLTFEL